MFRSPTITPATPPTPPTPPKPVRSRNPVGDPGGPRPQAGAPRASGGCFAGLYDALSRCLHPLRRRDIRPAAGGIAVPAGFALPAAERPGPLDPRRYIDLRIQAETVLQDFVAAPDFAVWEEIEDDHYWLHLLGPGEPSALLADGDHARRVGGHVVEVDPDLDGSPGHPFDGFKVLRNHLCFNLLGQIRRAPVSALYICAARDVPATSGGYPLVPRRRPVVLSIRRVVRGRPIQVDGPFSEARRQARSHAGAPALAAGWVFGMNAVFKAWGTYGNVTRVNGVGDVIGHGFDSSADRITPDMLPETGIQALFGLSRQALLRLVDETEAEALAFAGRHAEALSWVDPSRRGRGDAVRSPVAGLQAYAEECRRRIGLLRD